MKQIFGTILFLLTTVTAFSSNPTVTSSLPAWAQKQVSEVFNVNPALLTRHKGNILVLQPGAQLKNRNPSALILPSVYQTYYINTALYQMSDVFGYALSINPEFGMNTATEDSSSPDVVTKSETNMTINLFNLNAAACYLFSSELSLGLRVSARYDSQSYNQIYNYAQGTSQDIANNGNRTLNLHINPELGLVYQMADGYFGITLDGVYQHIYQENNYEYMGPQTVTNSSDYRQFKSDLAIDNRNTIHYQISTPFEKGNWKGMTSLSYLQNQSDYSRNSLSSRYQFESQDWGIGFDAGLAYEFDLIPGFNWTFAAEVTSSYNTVSSTNYTALSVGHEIYGGSLIFSTGLEKAITETLKLGAGFSIDSLSARWENQTADSSSQAVAISYQNQFFPEWTCSAGADYQLMTNLTLNLDCKYMSRNQPRLISRNTISSQPVSMLPEDTWKMDIAASVIWKL